MSTGVVQLFLRAPRPVDDPPRLLTAQPASRILVRMSKKLRSRARLNTQVDDAIAEVRAIMRSRPISYRELARRADVADGTIRNMMRTSWDPRASILSKILVEARAIGPLARPARGVRLSA